MDPKLQSECIEALKSVNHLHHESFKLEHKQDKVDLAFELIMIRNQINKDIDSLLKRINEANS